MRLRDNNDGVSFTCAAVAFVLVGCLIAVCGTLADFEPGLAKVGLVAYMCMAVPLLLASVSGVMTRARHRSFRSTPPDYMIGKRVKPRLWWLAYVGSSVALAALMGGCVFAVWVLGCIGRFPGHGGLVALIVFYGIPFLAFYIAYRAFVIISVRLGWMTREEAKEFRSMRRRRPEAKEFFTRKRRHWPEAWLEPLDDNQKK